MNVPRKKLAKPLRFHIEAPLGLGLSKGNRNSFGTESSEDFWQSLRFALRPPAYPDAQVIWLSPKSEGDEDTRGIEADIKMRRQLTSKIEGSLSFVTRGLALREDNADVPTSTIGILSHSPAYTSDDYGHTESYDIELNLNEREFNEIRDFFIQGKSPSEIIIWTPDVEYGEAPDGSDKVWQIRGNQDSTIAKIVGFSMSFSTDIPPYYIHARTYNYCGTGRAL